MHFVRFAPFVVLLVVGCGKSSPPPQHIQAWVESWGKMEMYLPSEDQIAFLRTNLSDVTPEQERLVRIYIINALAAVKFQSKEVNDLLRSRFDSLSSANVAPQLFGGYADVDEKINVAAALYNLTSGNDRQEYLEFVTKWLKPPSSDFGPVENEAYWERRWMAVIALEGMQGASAAIPLLESMLHEDGAKEWVGVHVPRVLGVLKRPGI